MHRASPAPEGQAGRDGGGLVPHLAVPLGDPAGEQQGLEPGVEVPGELHIGVTEEPLGRAGRGNLDGLNGLNGALEGGMDRHGVKAYRSLR